jgi:transposase
MLVLSPVLPRRTFARRQSNAVLNGAKQMEAAKLFGVTRQSVNKWVKAYKKGGRKQFEAKRRGRPKGGLLLPWQAAQIAKTVIDRPPEQLRLPFVLWTREAVSQLSEQGFGIRLSVWTIGRYLSRWGLTDQKPVRKVLGETRRRYVVRWNKSTPGSGPKRRQKRPRSTGKMRWD